jgi:hypothetical protein
MRLTVRLLALILLLAIGTFAYFGSRTTMADDIHMVIEETGNPCLEGCIRGEQSCTGGCGYNQSCVTKCKEEYRKCEASCK